MGKLSILEQIINSRIMNIHTAYLAKVISFNQDKADIQPLVASVSYDGASEPYPIIPNVPVIVSARKNGQNEELGEGAVVLAICCERDISSALKGQISNSSAGGMYSLSDSVIVGVL